MAASGNLEPADVIPFRLIEYLVSQLRGRDAAKVARYDNYPISRHLFNPVVQEPHPAAL